MVNRADGKHCGDVHIGQWCWGEVQINSYYHLVIIIIIIIIIIIMIMIIIIIIILIYI